MSLSLRGAGLLYRKAFWAYAPLYAAFKAVQDRPVRRFMSGLVCKGDTVIDVGANVGVYTRFLASLVGERGRVHAFEPDPENFRHLTAAVSGCPQVVLNDCAIGEDEGTVDLHLSSLINVDHRTYAHTGSGGVRQVRITTLDRYVRGQWPVRLVKMDIQGFEVAGLRGMAEVLEHNREIVVVAELWPFGLREAGSSAGEMTSLLTAHGFRLNLITTDGLSPLTPDVAATLPSNPEAFWDVAAFR